MANKAKSSKAASKVTTKVTSKNRKAAKKMATTYETPVSNIQKITYASGRVSYRVRVAGESQSTTSLKKAREIKKELFA
jgi:hypothetical protein